MKVTVLALVYVPVNLATSVFGMNLQQLNGNGQTLEIFFYNRSRGSTSYYNALVAS